MWEDARGVVYASRPRTAETLEYTVVQDAKQKYIAHARYLSRYSRCASLRVDDHLVLVTRMIHCQRYIHIVHILAQRVGTAHPARLRLLDVNRHRGLVLVVRRKVKPHRRHSITGNRRSRLFLFRLLWRGGNKRRGGSWN